MKKRTRHALIAGTTAVLVAGGGITAWKATEHRADQAFIADQHAKLEAEKAALEDDAPPAFYERQASFDCKNAWKSSDDARRYWEVWSVTTRPATEVAPGLYSISGHASGTDGRKDIESNFTCAALLDGDEWDISLS